MGGVGKTQLALLFCDTAKKGDDVPGGVFWVVADGAAEQVVSALGNLAGFLLVGKVTADERNQESQVVSVLQVELGKRKGSWLYIGLKSYKCMYITLTTHLGRAHKISTCTQDSSPFYGPSMGSRHRKKL